MHISKQQIEIAHERIQKYIRKTPCIVSGNGTFGLKHSISLKLEHLQHSGSFKARGAFNSLLNSPIPEAGVTAASGGNHGAAVACAAHALGLTAKIFVPEISNAAKVDKIRSYGLISILKAQLMQMLQPFARNTKNRLVQLIFTPMTQLIQSMVKEPLRWNGQSKALI